eukprot:COSAG03_NODE_4048_length_1708_cov_1.527035_3_plen_58_part_00
MVFIYMGIYIHGYLYTWIYIYKFYIQISHIYHAEQLQLVRVRDAVGIPVDLHRTTRM